MAILKYTLSDSTFWIILSLNCSWVFLIKKNFRPSCSYKKVLIEDNECNGNKFFFGSKGIRQAKYPHKELNSSEWLNLLPCLFKNNNYNDGIAIISKICYIFNITDSSTIITSFYNLWNICFAQRACWFHTSQQECCKINQSFSVLVITWKKKQWKWHLMRWRIPPTSHHFQVCNFFRLPIGFLGKRIPAQLPKLGKTFTESEEIALNN